jgi:hypothetical protein
MAGRELTMRSAIKFALNSEVWKDIEERVPTCLKQIEETGGFYTFKKSRKI